MATDRKICITVSDAELSAVATSYQEEAYGVVGGVLYRLAAVCRETIAAEARAADEHEAAQGDGMDGRVSASGGDVLVAALKVLNAASPELLDKVIADAVVRMQETSRGW